MKTDSYYCDKGHADREDEACRELETQDLEDIRAYECQQNCLFLHNKSKHHDERTVLQSTE